MPRRTDRTTLHTSEMRWEPLEIKGSQGMAWIKTLAKDVETGARTALIKFDPGFGQDKAVGQWPVDMYVLEGEMQYGDLRFQKGTYHYRPAGVEYGPITCLKGAIRLVFTADSRDEDRSEREPVFIQDVNQMPWVPSFGDPGTGEQRRLRVLRVDQKADYSLFINYHLPANAFREGLVHIHTTYSEEVFVIEGSEEQYSGDIDGHVNWNPWTYTCRAPNEGLHGDGQVKQGPCALLIRMGWTGKFANRHAPGGQDSDKDTLDLPMAQNIRRDFFIE